MTEGAKLVTSEPDSPEVGEKSGDTKLPVALPGVSHEHLEAIDGDRDKEKDKK